LEMQNNTLVRTSHNKGLIVNANETEENIKVSNCDSGELSDL